MKRVTSLSCMMLTVFFTQAQVTFQKVYRNSTSTISSANAVEQTSDGNFIVTGSSYQSATSDDVLLIKTDSNGAIIWSKTFGGAFEDVGSSVHQTPDGGYLICGSTESFGAGNKDYYLLKTDGSGNLLWSKAIGNADDDWTRSMELTQDGGCIIAGFNTPFGADGQLIRTDNSGNVLWAIRYDHLGNELIQMARQTADGGFIVVMQDYPVGLMIKTNSSGGIVWTKAFSEIVPNNVRVLPDNGYLVGGFYSGLSNETIALIRFDSTGTLMWSKYYDDGISQRLRSMHVTSDQNFLLSGEFTTIKVDGNGDTLWTKKYNGLGNQNSIWNSDLTDDGGFVFAGETTAGNVQYSYLVKTDSDGNSGCFEDYSPVAVNNISINVYSLSHSTIAGLTTTSVASTVSTGGFADSTLCYSYHISVEELDAKTKKYFSVYPNPANSYLTIVSSLPGEYVFQLTNLQGKMIYSGRTEESENTLELNELPPGIYFLRINSGEQIQVERVCVVR